MTRTPARGLYAGAAASSQPAGCTLDTQTSAQPEKPAGHGGICDGNETETTGISSSK